MLPEAFRGEYSRVWQQNADNQTAEHLRRVSSEDATGAPVDAWPVIGTFRGSLTQASGQRESFQGEQPHAAANWVWAMTPYDLAANPLPESQRLKAKDRLRIEGREFDVIGDDGGRSGATRLLVQLVAVD
jgi:hypothetical protein